MWKVIRSLCRAGRHVDIATSATELAFNWSDRVNYSLQTIVGFECLSACGSSLGNNISRSGGHVDVATLVPSLPLHWFVRVKHSLQQIKSLGFDVLCMWKLVRLCREQVDMLLMCEMDFVVDNIQMSIRCSLGRQWGPRHCQWWLRCV